MEPGQDIFPSGQSSPETMAASASNISGRRFILQTGKTLWHVILRRNCVLRGNKIDKATAAGLTDDDGGHGSKIVCLHNLKMTAAARTRSRCSCQIGDKIRDREQLINN